MLKLLRAGFARLWRDKIFWRCVAAAALTEAFSMSNGAFDDYEQRFTDGYFFVVAMLAFVYAVFISLFLGAEYSCGTIRNKITVGNTRANIYLSNFFVCLVGDFIILLGWFLGGGYMLLRAGVFSAAAQPIWQALAVLAAATAALTALLVAFNMAFNNHAVKVVASLVLVVAMLFVSSRVNNALCEKETVAGYEFDDAGNFVLSEPYPNPKYISGTKRKAYEFVEVIVPGGTMQQLASNSALDYPAANAAAALCETVIFTAAGYALFDKKDIN